MDKIQVQTRIKMLLFGFILCTLILSNGTACHRGGAPGSVAAAEAKLEKEAKASKREAKKAKKQAEKRYWSMQTKEAKRSIKRNLRAQKRKARNLD